MLSNHSTMKLKINDKRNFTKPTNKWKLNNILLSNEWVAEGIKKTIFAGNQKYRFFPEPVGCNESSLQRKIYCCELPHQENRMNTEE